jgi:hypothetical protein
MKKNKEKNENGRKIRSYEGSCSQDFVVVITHLLS